MRKQCTAAGSGESANNDAFTTTEQSADEHSDAGTNTDVKRLSVTAINIRPFISRVRSGPRRVGSRSLRGRCRREHRNCDREHYCHNYGCYIFSTHDNFPLKSFFFIVHAL